MYAQTKTDHDGWLKNLAYAIEVADIREAYLKDRGVAVVHKKQFHSESRASMVVCNISPLSHMYKCASTD